MSQTKCVSLNEERCRMAIGKRELLGGVKVRKVLFLSARSSEWSV